jgi:hypothetical protein
MPLRRQGIGYSFPYNWLLAPDEAKAAANAGRMDEYERIMEPINERDHKERTERVAPIVTPVDGVVPAPPIVPGYELAFPERKRYVQVDPIGDYMDKVEGQKQSIGSTPYLVALIAIGYPDPIARVVRDYDYYLPRTMEEAIEAEEIRSGSYLRPKLPLDGENFTRSAWPVHGSDGLPSYGDTFYQLRGYGFKVEVAGSKPILSFASGIHGVDHDHQTSTFLDVMSEGTDPWCPVHVSVNHSRVPARDTYRYGQALKRHEGVPHWKCDGHPPSASDRDVIFCYPTRMPRYRGEIYQIIAWAVVRDMKESLTDAVIHDRLLAVMSVPPTNKERYRDAVHGIEPLPWTSWVAPAVPLRVEANSHEEAKMIVADWNEDDWKKAEAERDATRLAAEMGRASLAAVKTEQEYINVDEWKAFRDVIAAGPVAMAPDRAWKTKLDTVLQDPARTSGLTANYMTGGPHLQHFRFAQQSGPLVPPPRAETIIPPDVALADGAAPPAPPGKERLTGHYSGCRGIGCTRYINDDDDGGRWYCTRCVGRICSPGCASQRPDGLCHTCVDAPPDVPPDVLRNSVQWKQAVVFNPMSIKLFQDAVTGVSSERKKRHKAAYRKKRRDKERAAL